jgi:Protein of unknown function (DUF982)
MKTQAERAFGPPIGKAATLAQAHAQLLNGWPKKGTALHAHALHACRLASLGRFPINKARAAFERAAREARIL